MRAVLILLVVANLAYLAWQQDWWPGAAELPVAAEEEAAFRPASQSLLLLDELPQEQLDLMASLAQARSSRAGAAEQLTQIQQEVATVESNIGEVQADLAENRARSAEVQQALLDTLDAAINDSPQTQATPAVPPELPLPWCARAGVFGDLAEVAAFVRALQALGVEGVAETREEPISSTWWVHMPAFASEALAMDKLAELQAKNIDSYYMRTGEMAGGISLGVFARQESALIAQQQRADQGYATSIREVFRMGERLYVTLRMPDATLRESPEWTAFLASAGGIEVSENACETIASENEFP